jgi:tetratricopeptide (TPR) repeat protein
MLPPITTMAVDSRDEVVAIGKDSLGTYLRRDHAISPFVGLEHGEKPRWLSNDATSLLVYSDKGGRVFDIRTSRPYGMMEGADFSRYDFNGTTLATQDPDRLNLILWDTKTGQRLGNFQVAKVQIADVALSSGRTLLAVAADTDQIKFWDIRQPSQPIELRSVSTNKIPIMFIMFAPAGNTLAAVCEDKGVRLFDANSGAQVATVPFSESSLSAWTFDAKGNFLAIALKNGAIKIWDCVKQRTQLDIPASDVTADRLAFTSADELVVAGSDRVIRIWSLKGDLLKTLGHLKWEPRNAPEAERLSGLMLCDPLNVRFLNPEEEKSLGIDAMQTSEELRIAGLWPAEKATRCNLKALEKQLELSTDDDKKADLVGKWLSDDKKGDLVGKWLSEHKSSNGEMQAWVALARNHHDAILRKLGTQIQKAGIDALFRREFARALTIFEQTLRIVPEDDAREYFAWRGLARRYAGDERGAVEDRKAFQKSESVNRTKWTDPLLQRALNSDRLQLASSFILWLFPDDLNGSYCRALSNFELKHYDEALRDVNAAISSDSGNIKPADLDWFLLLRGRILNAQHSLDARKDWQQLSDSKIREHSALGHLFLGHFDVVEPYYKERASKGLRSDHLELARFFAVRSASFGNKESRDSDVTAAIEELRKGDYVGDNLRTALLWSPDFDALQNDRRFKALLTQEKAVEPASLEEDSE